jgi:hypothetical protein
LLVGEEVIEESFVEFLLELEGGWGKDEWFWVRRGEDRGA